MMADETTTTTAGGGGRMSWARNTNDERHKGSYDLQEIKQSEQFKLRIEPALHPLKRKYALCFGYVGSAYQGLQINPGIKTIEAELEKAIYLCGGMLECNYGYLQKIQFTRAARTGAVIAFLIAVSNVIEHCHRVYSIVRCDRQWSPCCQSMLCDEAAFAIKQQQQQ